MSRKWIHLFVVYRYDPQPSMSGSPDSINNAITINSVWDTEAEADSETHRLQTLNAMKGSKYFFQSAKYYSPGILATASVSDQRQERLRNFFAAYFHEDWDAEVSDWVGLLHAYITESTQSQVAQLVADLTWLASRSDAETLLYEELGCYYDPTADGVSIGDWLVDVATELRRLGAIDG